MKKSIALLSLIMVSIFTFGQTYSVTNYTTSNSGIVSNDILSIRGTNSGDVWFGTNGSGVSKLDGSTWTTYTTSQGLAGNTVKGIYEDHLGNIWFATNNGVSKYTGSTWATYDTGDGLPTNDLRCVFEDNSNNIWVGTSGGGVCKYNGSNWTTYDTGDGLAQNFVQAITQDSSDNMWFATANGVSRLNGSTWTTYTSSNGLIANGDEVLSAMTDIEGNVWFGSKPGFGIGGGLSMFDGSTWTTYNNTNGLASNEVRGMDTDAKNRLWFSTFVNGASQFKSGTFTTYSTPHGMVSSTMQCVDVAPDGYVWFGTSGGASKMATIVYQGYDVENNYCGNSNSGEITLNAGTISSMLYYSFDNGSTYQASNTITGLATGSYTTWVTDSSIFLQNAVIDIIDQANADAFSFDSTVVCYGDSTQLDPDASFTNFTWTPDSVVSDHQITNPYIFPLTPQWINIEYTDSNSCVVSDSVYFSILPAPAFSVDITDDSIFTVDNTFITYQWYHYGAAISGATLQSYTADQAGIYMVCVTDAAGCDACSGMIHYQNTGIEDHSEGIHAYISGNILYYDIPEGFEFLEIYSYDGRLLEKALIEKCQSYIILQNNHHGALIIRVIGDTKYGSIQLFR